MANPEKEIDGMARDCIAVRLRLLNRVITNVYDEALRPLGLKVSQMNVLVVAAKLGTARPAEVCRILQMDTSTLSRNVERLRARRWLEAEADRQDGRAQLFRITAEGRRLLSRALPAWKQAQKRASEILGEEGTRSLREAASRLGLPASRTAAD